MSETKEYAIIKIEKFRDDDGNPTCAVNMLNGQWCRFLGSRKFGAIDVCMYGEQKDLRVRPYTRYTIPHKECPVWAEAEES